MIFKKFLKTPIINRKWANLTEFTKKTDNDAKQGREGDIGGNVAKIVKKSLFV